MKIKSNIKKFKPSSKNKQTLSITPRVTTKSKLEYKTLKDKKQEFKNIVKNRYSISSKEDIKKKASQTFVKPILKTSSNILGTSNGALPTNYTDKEEEKKNRQSLICKNNINYKEETKLRYLGNLFRTSNLKKTIIIDGDGNNNLNINKDLFAVNINNKEEQKVKNKNGNLKKSKSTHKQIISDNLMLNIGNLGIQNSKNIKKENNERLIEYNFIFDLLNTNIEEMKDMFINSPLIIKDNKKEKNKQRNKRNYIQIFSEKDKEEINKIKPLNESENKNNKENSFLESCFQDDFYKNFVDEDQTPIVNVSNCSFDFSSAISEKSNSIIINTYSDKTQCEIDENIDTNNYIHNFEINPHTLISKKNENKTLKKNKNGSKSTSNINLSNDKCAVF